MSKKQELMSILTSLPVNQVSNELMLWAAEYLPDEDGKSDDISNFHVDHEKESTMEAAEIEKEDTRKFAEIFSYTGSDKKKVSEKIVQIMIEQKNNHKFWYFLIARVFNEMRAAYTKRMLGGLGDLLKGIASADSEDEIKELLKKEKKKILGEESSDDESGPTFNPDDFPF